MIMNRKIGKLLRACAGAGEEICKGIFCLPRNFVAIQGVNPALQNIRDASEVFFAKDPLEVFKLAHKSFEGKVGRTVEGSLGEIKQLPDRVNHMVCSNKPGKFALAS